MKKIALKLADALVTHGLDKSKYNIYAYGIERILTNACIIALIIIGGLIIGKFPHTLVFLVSWYPLRMLVGGMHTKTQLICTVVSISLSLVSVALTDIINSLPDIAIYIALVISLIIVFLRAPVIHKNHPISDSQKKRMRIAARVLITLETAAIAVMVFFNCEYAGASFMGCSTTALLSIIVF